MINISFLKYSRIKVSDKNISAIPFPMLSFINWVTQKIIDKNARISLNILLNTCCNLFRKIKKTFINELISIIVYLAKFILDEKNVSALK